MDNRTPKILSDFGTIVTGNTPSSSHPEDFGTEVLFVTPSDSFEQKFISKTGRGLSHSGKARLSNRCLPSNSIIVTCIGSDMGKLALNRTEAVTNQQINSIVVNTEEFDANYLYYTLKNNYKTLRQAAGGSTALPILNKTDFSALEILVHTDIGEQQQIAAVLSALDAKIEGNNRINTELEAMAKTLYDYWFVQFDFPNAAGKPYKSSGGKMVWCEEVKREIPEGWNPGIIKDLGLIISGGTPSTQQPNYFTNSGIPWITPKDLSNTADKYISRGATDITALGLKNSSAKLIPANSVLLTARAPIGYLAISLNEVCTNQGFKSIVPDVKYGTEYVYQTLKSLVPRFQVLGAKSTFKEISKELLANVPIVLPEEAISRLFKETIEPFSLKRMAAEKENLHLSHLRDWLLPMLMNGQVQVAAQISEVETPDLRIAAEPKIPYSLPAGNLAIPKGRAPFMKQVLGGKIVSLFREDAEFTHIKFQKIQYLAEHVAKADFCDGYYVQAAGPYDPQFMHSVAGKMQKSKWFEERDRTWHPLEKQAQIDQYYPAYFGTADAHLAKLFLLLAGKTEAETEKIATLYAVWNNRIILHQSITDAELIADFYHWSERKQRYAEAELLQTLVWMRENGIVPTGFGKELKRAKEK